MLYLAFFIYSGLGHHETDSRSQGSTGSLSMAAFFRTYPDEKGVRASTDQPVVVAFPDPSRCPYLSKASPWNEDDVDFAASTILSEVGSMIPYAPLQSPVWIRQMKRQDDRPRLLERKTVSVQASTTAEVHFSRMGM
jgi:hypothetical protein